MDKKKLGLASIVLLGFNSIIGSGIFLLPSRLYHLAGDWSVLLVLITAAIVATIAFSFAEVSGYFSKNGAAYVYTKEAFGQFAGFEVGFLKWIMQCIAWGVMAVALTNILANTFHFEDDTMLRSMIIFGIVTSLTLLNLRGVNATKIVNNVSTLAKMLPLVILIAGGVWYINPEFIIPAGNAAGAAAEYTLSGETLGSALILCFYAYTGFETFGTAAEDMENPKRNLPLAIVYVIIAVMVFYALVMAVCVGVLGPDIANSKVPVADTARAVFGDWGFYMITIGSIISLAGINVAASFHIPRALLPLSEDKMLPEFFGKKNANGVPTVAIIASALVTIPIALSGSFTTLAMLSVVTRFAQYIPTCLAVLVFRKRYADNPEMQPTFKVPFGPTLPALGVAICLFLLADQNPTKIMVGLGAMVAIAPLYFMAQKRAKEAAALADA